MLILTRRKEESIVIGDEVSVRVLEVCGGCVKLGISAPKDIDVYRDELCRRIYGNKSSDENGVGTEDDFE